MQQVSLQVLLVSVCVLNTLESMRDPLKEAELLPTLKKILDDPVGAVEVKFSALGLICTLANSSMFCCFYNTQNILKNLLQIEFLLVFLFLCMTTIAMRLSVKYKYKILIKYSIIIKHKILEEQLCDSLAKQFVH